MSYSIDQRQNNKNTLSLPPSLYFFLCWSGLIFWPPSIEIVVYALFTEIVPICIEKTYVTFVWNYVFLPFFVRFLLTLFRLLIPNKPIYSRFNWVACMRFVFRTRLKLRQLQRASEARKHSME